MINYDLDSHAWWADIIIHIHLIQDDFGMNRLILTGHPAVNMVLTEKIWQNVIIIKLHTTALLSVANHYFLVSTRSKYQKIDYFTPIMKGIK